MENYRLGNIELRHTMSLRDVPYWEIVCWYPNCHYQKEADFVWDEYKQMYKSKDSYGYYVSKSAFTHPESCYTIAIFDKDNEDEPDLRSVGSRPFHLTDDDYKNYHDVAKYAYGHLNDMYESDNY